jgi:feruloyl esterase
MSAARGRRAGAAACALVASAAFVLGALPVGHARAAEAPVVDPYAKAGPASDACLRYMPGPLGGAADPQAAATLRSLLRLPDAPTVITAVESVPAAGDLPAYCRFKGTIAPQIHFELRLPTEAWNGKLLMQGCGGMCGWINMGATEDSLARRYAVVNTDMGHVDPPGVALFGRDNRSAELDFAYRSTWATAQVARVLTESFYASRPKRTYFNGCSTGGRQGMLAAQRFPELFDGIIAGAPVLNWTGNGMLHLAWLAQANVGANGRAILTRAKLAKVNERVVAACDRMDGVADGLVPDPHACPWRPEQMACAGGGSGNDCLSPLEIRTLQKFYTGAANASGLLRTASGGGAAPGSEYGWFPMFVGDGEAPGAIATGEGSMLDQLAQSAWFYLDPGASATTRELDYDRDVPRLALTEVFYNAQNPDLRRFQARGGKLILWHGWDDVEVPPGYSTDYYELATRTMGGPEATRSFFRLFMLPGVQHCRRGHGADAIDLLTALEQWVENGVAPDSLLAHKLVKEQPYLGLPRPRFPLPPSDYEWRRPVYAYPQAAVYTGRGDWKDPANWQPRTLRKGTP